MDIPQRDVSHADFRPNWPLIFAFIVFVAVGAFAVFFLASTRTIPVLPTPASAQSQQTDNLFYILLGVGAIVFFLVQGLLLYAVIRFRAKPNDTSDGPNVHGIPLLEIVWTIIPAVVVVILSGASVFVWSNNTAQRENENFINGKPVDIRVLAKRFQWSFLYDTGEVDSKGNPIILDELELHTYENQNVWLQMNAADVIHSFWVPEMRIKQDVMPGKTTEIRFTPINTGLGYKFAYQFDEANPLGQKIDIAAADANNASIANRFNEYQVVCTELCGGGHGEMHTRIVVHENEDSFLKWYNAQVESKRNPPDDPVLLGEQLLNGATYPCKGCHALSSLGWTGQQGPDLSEIAVRAGNRAKTTGDESGAAYIMHSIRHSQDYLVPGYGPIMPAFQGEDSSITATYMPDDHLIGIVAFLCTRTGTDTVQADSTCGLEFGDNNLPVDPAATTEYLKGLAAKLDNDPNT